GARGCIWWRAALRDFLSRSRRCPERFRQLVAARHRGRLRRTGTARRSPWLQLAATLVKPFSRGQLLETVREVLLAADDASSRTAPFFPVPPGGDLPQITPAL